MNTTYRSRLAKLELLLKGTGAKAFAIAVEVRALWMDREFLANECDGNVDRATELLERFTDAVSCDLADLLQMIEHFPEEKDWKDGQLRILREKTMDLISKKRSSKVRGDGGETVSGSESPKPTRRNVTIAEYEDLQRRFEELERKYKQSQAELRRQRSEYEKLLDKIPQLAKVK